MGPTLSRGLALPSPSWVPGPVLETINTHVKQRHHPAWTSQPSREADQGIGSNDMIETGKNQGPASPTARERAPDRESGVCGSLNSLELVSHGDAKLLGQIANRMR